MPSGRFLTLYVTATAMLVGCSQPGQPLAVPTATAVAPRAEPGPDPRAHTMPVLPANPEQSGQSRIERYLRNAVGLFVQHRYDDAQAELDRAIRLVPAGTALWQGLLCAEMTLLIRADRLGQLQALDSQIEPQLYDTLHPPPQCLVQIAVARGILSRHMRGD